LKRSNSVIYNSGLIVVSFLEAIAGDGPSQILYVVLWTDILAV